MAQLEIIVIGASAGSLQGLTDLVGQLPADLPAAVLVVVHTRSEYESVLPSILSRATPLPIDFARNGQPLKNGTVVVAPPDCHLLVDSHRIVLNRGPRENGFRPAIDPLFRSAARDFGAGAAGVILSGALDDGSAGLKRIKESGGIAVVQDPDEAPVPSMPQSAIRAVQVDHIMRAAEIGRLLARLARNPVEGEVAMSKTTREPDPQKPGDETEIQDMNDTFGPPSGLTCPDCGGALWEIKDGKLLRYRCHVGHQFQMESLDSEQQQAVEAALWTAVRVLEERADLRERMSRRAEDGGMASVASGFLRTAGEAKQQAATIRELLLTPPHDADERKRRRGKAGRRRAKPRRPRGH